MPRRLQDFEAANRAFHQALVAPCGMPRLLASLDGLQLRRIPDWYSRWRAVRDGGRGPIRITA